MNDRRIASGRNDPGRCPVCLGDLDWRGVCRECGRSFDPPTPLTIPALRRLAFDRGPPWYENPLTFGIGILSLIPFAIFAYNIPHILVPFVLLLLAAGMRTLRIATRLQMHEARSTLAPLIGGLVASFGVASLAGIASVVVFTCVLLFIPGGNSISSPLYVYVLGLLAASSVFLLLFVLLWPRGRSGDRPPDPEN